VQHSWNLINAALRTSLPVRFEADQIACGVIFLASRQCKLHLTEDDPPWWRLFHVSEATLREVAYVTLAVLDVYERDPPTLEHFPELCYC
jgi:hypothetical protein